MRTTSFTVNGHPASATAEARTSLADYLREQLLLTGTHLGCEHGVCGACTVMIDGAPARACITLAAACEGADVRTIEGFDEDPVMARLRAAFTRHHALQCGYCTPGMLVTARDIVRRLPDADEARVRDELAGNLCRCTGYMGIVEAIREVLANPPGVATHEAVGEEPNAASPGPATQAPPVSLPRATAAIGTSGATSTSPATPAAATGSGGATRLTRRVSVRTSADRLWAVLRDPTAVVQCMPGAELTGAPEGERLPFRLTVAIGPMRAAFEGTADVHYDDDTRTGALDGKAGDAASRSTGEGRVEFRAEATGGEASALALAIDYRIKGPLAQFSRGAVVESVVDRLLERFAANLGTAASGGTVADDAPVGGIGLLLKGLIDRVKRLLGG